MISEEELLFCGGPNGTHCFSLSLNTFCVASKKPMALARKNHALIAYKTKVFALGGYSEMTGDTTKSCEVYDTYLDKWNSIQDMHFSRESLGATLLQSA